MINGRNCRKIEFQRNCPPKKCESVKTVKYLWSLGETVSWTIRAIRGICFTVWIGSSLTVKHKISWYLESADHMTNQQIIWPNDSCLCKHIDYPMPVVAETTEPTQRMKIKNEVQRIWQNYELILPNQIGINAGNRRKINPNWFDEVVPQIGFTY